MTLGDHGIVYVGSMTEGKVYAVIPNDTQTQAKQVITIASDLKLPNGVAYRNGALYVSALNKILRYDNIENNLPPTQAPTLITDQLPDKEWHGWRYIAFGPDDWLYIGVGAPCNVCL